MWGGEAGDFCPGTTNIRLTTNQLDFLDFRKNPHESTKTYGPVLTLIVELLQG